MFDVNDKIYCANDSFRPDKESTWSYPPEQDGWFHAHNAIRGELSDIHEALETIEKRGHLLNDWEVLSIQRVTKEHFDHIHSHHTNEDRIFMTELSNRINFPKKISEDHVELMNKINELELVLMNLKANKFLKESGLLYLWTEYESYMCEHLREEEAIGLPLMRAYYRPEEIAPIIQKLIKHSPKVELGSFIHYMGPNRFRTEFMKQEHIPVFVWYIEFNAKHKYFDQAFVSHVKALKLGDKNVIMDTPESWWTYFFSFLH
jgi:Hemerythrin HHE cation binding domain